MKKLKKIFDVRFRREEARINTYKSVIGEYRDAIKLATERGISRSVILEALKRVEPEAFEGYKLAAFNLYCNRLMIITPKKSSPTEDRNGDTKEQEND